MKQHYRAPWSNKLKFMTVGIMVLLVVICFIAGPITRMIIAAIVFGCVVFSVRGYSIHEGMLKVNHWGWSKNYDLSKLKAVEYNPSATLGSIRVFGIGGLFGFIGYFRNSVIGSYHAYATNKKNTVVLNFDGTEVVITPKEPVKFVQTVKKIKG